MSCVEMVIDYSTANSSRSQGDNGTTNSSRSQGDKGTTNSSRSHGDKGTTISSRSQGDKGPDYPQCPVKAKVDNDDSVNNERDDNDDSGMYTDLCTFFGVVCSCNISV